MGREKNKYLGHRELPLIRHKIALERSYPGCFCELKRNVLTWRALITPTVLSRGYQVQIEYNGHRMPKVTVSGDSLRGLSKPNFPHHYDIDIESNRVRICLCLSSELDYTKPFSETLVPWAAEWLFHYEIWLATGEWRGGGIHPSRRKTKTDFKRKFKELKRKRGQDNG